MRIWDPITSSSGAILTSHAAGNGGGDRPGWQLAGHRRRDGTVRIWDAATGQQRAALTGHDGRVMAVAIAPDGSWLATGSDDGTVRIWDLTAGRQRVLYATSAW